MLCILENRINAHSLQDPFFYLSHSIFLKENSCHNFVLSSLGRIWIKWNATKMNFNPTHISSQIIFGTVSVASYSLFQLSVIYASNSSLDRKELWATIAQIAPIAYILWALLGDFNCCRYASKTLGVPQPLNLHCLISIV